MGTLVPTLQMRESRHREIKELAQGHGTKQKRWIRASEPGWQAFRVRAGHAHILLLRSDSQISSNGRAPENQSALG